MALKETYEEMSDEELLERYKDFQDYRDDAKTVILEELRKRKLAVEEEINKNFISLNSLEKNQNESNKINEKMTNSKKSKLKWYHILIVLIFLNHTNITHLIAIGFDMMGFHSGYVFMLKTTYVLDFREKSALPTKLLADDYFWKKDYKNAQKYYSNAHAFSQHENRNKKIKNETELTALVGYTLSDLYLGNHSSLEDYEWQIIEFAEENKDMIKGVTTYESVYYFYRDVSRLYEEKKDYPNALKYMEKARKYSSGYSIFELYKLTGDLYFKSNDYEKAREFYKKALDFDSKKEGLDEWHINLLEENKRRIEKNLAQIGGK